MYHLTTGVLTRKYTLYPSVHNADSYFNIHCKLYYNLHVASSFFQDVCNSTGAKIKVNFFNEESQEEAQWFIAMETSMSTRSLLESIRQPWEAAFGVGMEIVQADFDEGS